MKAQLSALGIGVTLRQLAKIRLGRLYQYPPRPLSVTRLARADEEVDLPQISVVTPSFNQAPFVVTTLSSVVGQNYPRLQYVVQDAQSGDGTGEILERYRQSGVDIRIEADNGQTDALNRGFARSSGEIMAYLNSDDFWLPGTLGLVGRYFRDHPSADVIYGNRLIVDEHDREVGRWVLPDHDEDVLRLVDYVPQETMFWRRAIWERAGGRFDTRFRFAMDWDLILRFMEAGAEFHHVPELFAVFRVHGMQKSQADFLARGAQEMAEVRARSGVEAVSLQRRVRLHYAYLARHRRADASFEASLRESKEK
ncbi:MULTISPECIES: glycosyltransferase family 2 protein [unclassified Sinorhizobium]|uniref:glycosyltransferase family 2 protein n=1 Tax=unclassified Sinorhizobium TaxID=2613772 RepID=UPI003524F755